MHLWWTYCDSLEPIFACNIIKYHDMAYVWVGHSKNRENIQIILKIS